MNSPDEQEQTKNGRHELWAELDRLQMDLRAATARLVAIRSYVAGLNVAALERIACPDCGTKFRTIASVQEHRYHSHGGPLPASYEAAERAAGLDPR